MCIFISASCIYATDIDDANGNIIPNDSYIENLDDDRFARKTVSKPCWGVDNSAKSIDNVSDFKY